LKPAHLELDERNVVLTKKQQELNEQRVVLNDLPRFRKETEEMKKKRQVALKQLPDKKEIDKLLQDISYHAIESGLVVLLFKPQKEIKKNFYAEIPVDIKLSGTYHDQAMFFDKIANLQRIVNVSSSVPVIIATSLSSAKVYFCKGVSGAPPSILPDILTPSLTSGLNGSFLPIGS